MKIGPLSCQLSKKRIRHLNKAKLSFYIPVFEQVYENRSTQLSAFKKRIRDFNKAKLSFDKPVFVQVYKNRFHPAFKKRIRFQKKDKSSVA